MPIKFEFTGEASDLSRALREVVGGMNDVKTKTEAASFSLKEMLKQTAAVTGVGLGMAGLKQFGTSILNVRKEIQGLETSFEVLLGSKDKAAAMFGELKEFAVTTPLMLNDLAGGAQTMLGFNIEAEKVVPTLKAIGDISMGNSQKFQSLTLAFSQMSATGKLMGQDLLQMINAGFNPLTEISRKTGKSIGELKDEMSKGAISADMIADAFASATQEGGQFFGMLEKQGKGIAGQMNTLNGAIDDLLNTLGTQSEDIIKGTIQGLTTLVQNYETVGRVITTLIATYGAYKAALMTTIAVERIHVLGLKDAVYYTWLEITATKAATAAHSLLNKVCKANPYVLLATAIVAAAGAIWTYEKNAEKAANAQKNVNKAIDDFKKSEQELADEVGGLMNILQNQDLTDRKRKDAYDQLKLKCKELTDEYSQEELAVMSLKDAYEALQKAQDKRTMNHLKEEERKAYNAMEKLRNAHGSWGNIDADTYAYLESQGMIGKTTYRAAALMQERVNEWNRKITEQQDAFDEEKTEQKIEDKKKYTDEELKQMAQDAKRMSDLEQKQALDRKRREKDTELNAEQARIDAMKEGTEKTIQQIKLDYEKEKEAIKREQEDLVLAYEQEARELWEAKNAATVRKNPNAWNTSGARARFKSGFSLSAAETGYFANRNNANEAKQQASIEDIKKAEQEAQIALLQQFGGYLEQKEGLERDYAARIAKARSDAERKLLDQQKQQELQQLDEKFGQTAKGIEAIFDTLEKQSRESIDKTIEAYKYLLATMADGSQDGTERTQLEGLGFSPEFLNRIKTGQVTIEQIRSELERLKQASKNAGTAIEKWGDAWKDAFDGKKSPEERTTALLDAMGRVNQAVGMVTSSVADMADAFGNEELASAMDDIGNVMNSTMSMAQQGASIGGPIGAAAGAALGLATSLTQVFTRRHDDKLQKQIEQADKKLKGLDKTYQDLGDSIDKAYGTDKQKLIGQQISNLQQQNQVIRQQIDLEEQKHKTDKQAVESYRDAIEQNKKQIAELQQSAKDAIFGSDLQQAIEDFANAYADAWANGANRSRTAKEQVRQMMQDMVKESIKAAVSASGAMEQIRAKLTDFFRDGIISEAEQQIIYKDAERIQQNLDKQFGWADSMLDNDKSFTQGTSGGFQTMSQQSADELNGRFAAMQIGQQQLIAQGVQLVSGQQATNSLLSDILRGNALRNIYINNIIEQMGAMQKQITEQLAAINTNTKNI